MELDYNAIGIRIRQIRKQRGFTQQELAELSSQEPSNISHIERGATKLSLPTLVSIVNALDVSVDEIICDSMHHSSHVYHKIAQDLLSDCSHSELRIITDTMRALKENLRSVN